MSATASDRRLTGSTLYSLIVSEKPGDTCAIPRKRHVCGRTDPGEVMNGLERKRAESFSALNGESTKNRSSLSGRNGVKKKS